MSTAIVFIVIGLLTLMAVAIHVGGRMSARRSGLGSMSESWLAEERAASAATSPRG